ncbi:hypothetical protein JX266_004010 [Neoarthrinium moseri]|nr:hypothetical protein JX266_004010 [Neoarthrinium moseri]
MSSTQTVLITGCSDGGIGSALALIFQQRGFHVFATARDVSKMSKLNCLSNVTLLTLDVVKSDHMKVVVETGPIALTQAFAPLLIKAGGTYAASKKSIEIVADTLRLELAPFGVSVLKVVTGGVKSLGQTYIEDFALSAQSLYKEIENAIASRAQGNGGMPRMDTMEYALAVADEITKRTSGRFWFGSYADRVQLSTTSTAVPQSAMDAGAVVGSGLEKLAK